MDSVIIYVNTINDNTADFFVALAEYVAGKDASYAIRSRALKLNFEDVLASEVSFIVSRIRLFCDNNQVKLYSIITQRTHVLHFL